MENQFNQFTIKTPEGISFSFTLAGPLLRFLARVIDYFCIILIFSILMSLLGAIKAISWDVSIALMTVAAFVISIGYNIFLEWAWKGQTMGKKLLRLRVMDEEALVLQPSQVIIRNLLRFIDGLPVLYVVGGIACFLSKKAQRLGDFAAGTIVVRQPKIIQPNLEKVLSDKFNSFKAYPHLEARLRQNVTPHEAGLAFQALLRRDELDPEARVKLFKEMASHFREKVQFPEEATFGLTDEQYVKNVVDTMYRKVNSEKK